MGVLHAVISRKMSERDAFDKEHDDRNFGDFLDAIVGFHNSALVYGLDGTEIQPLHGLPNPQRVSPQFLFDVVTWGHQGIENAG